MIKTNPWRISIIEQTSIWRVVIRTFLAQTEGAIEQKLLMVICYPFFILHKVHIDNNKLESLKQLVVQNKLCKLFDREYAFQMAFEIRANLARK